MKNNHFKLLFITHEYDTEKNGGIARVVNGVTPLIQESINIDVLLLTNKKIGISFKKFKFFKKRNNKRIIKCYYRFGLALLIKKIREGRYSAVHLFHVSDIMDEVAKLITTTFPKLKIVYSCHSLAKFESHIRNNKPENLKYEHFIIHHSDHIHLLNQSSLKYFRQTYPSALKSIPYSIIPNGIDEQSFKEKDIGFERKLRQLVNQKRTIKVVCLSRWSHGKGLEYFLEAVSKVIDNHQNIQFIIAGRKSMSWEYNYKEYLKRINKKIKDLGDFVISLGWLNDSQRNSLFALADILVMPSQLEYCPYSILEPMIAKVPIISSRLECIQEMLINNESCLFYEPQDSSQLAEKIVFLSQRKDLCRRIAYNAYQIAVNSYKWEDISEMYVKMYQDTLNGIPRIRVSLPNSYATVGRDDNIVPVAHSTEKEKCEESCIGHYSFYDG